MKWQITIGDMVIHKETNVVGEVIRQYYPTASAEQTMVKTLDGRKYHAPTSEWKHYEYSDIAAPLCQDVATDAAAPVMVKHDYRKIKVAEDTYITIDLEDLKKQMEREFYNDPHFGLNYGA